MIQGIGINDLPGWCKSKDLKKRWLYNEWASMIKRCYSKKLHEEYPTYKECTTCERWLTFSNFVEDAPNLPGWEVVIEYNFKGVNLDKDARIPGNKIYSLETCMWMTRSDNVKEVNIRCGMPTPNKPVIAVNPNGEVFEYESINKAARQIGAGKTAINRACNMVYGSHTLKKGIGKGWTFVFKK